MPKLRREPMTIELPAAALAWHDKGRREWVGHVMKIEDGNGVQYMTVDYVTDKGDGQWQLHLIPLDQPDINPLE